MTISPKFTINSIVQHKFDKSTVGKKHALEVLEIQTQTCYGGTQIFYICRPLLATQMRSFSDDKIKTEWEVCCGSEYVKLREDELIKPSEEEINIIINK